MRCFRKIFNVLAQENTIGSIGFMAGMIYTIFKDKEMCPNVYYKHLRNEIIETDIKIEIPKSSLIENPLMTLLAGSITGALYSVCSSMVANILPTNLRPLVPICLSMSVANSVYKFYKTNELNYCNQQ